MVSAWRGAIIGVLVGMLLGTACGLLASSNFYEYHVVDTARGEHVLNLVNQGGWEPVPGSFSEGATGYLRRPRIRLS